eukprot:gene13240-19076_t
MNVHASQMAPGKTRHARKHTLENLESLFTSGSKQQQQQTDGPVETDPSGRYSRYDNMLGRGACKKVYAAFDSDTGMEVAWNQVELAGTNIDDDFRGHLFQEIRVLQHLKHRNIMSFHAWWYSPQSETINFITEYFTSGTLRQYRKKTKAINEQIIKRWAWQILAGLVYLHGHDPPIVHRDLKCDNIFINGETGVVKIGDLGVPPQALSRVTSDELRCLIELCISHDPHDRPELLKHPFFESLRLKSEAAMVSHGDGDDDDNTVLGAETAAGKAFTAKGVACTVVGGACTGTATEASLFESLRRNSEAATHLAGANANTPRPLHETASMSRLSKVPSQDLGPSFPSQPSLGVGLPPQTRFAHEPERPPLSRAHSNGVHGLIDSGDPVMERVMDRVSDWLQDAGTISGDVSGVDSGRALSYANQFSDSKLSLTRSTGELGVSRVGGGEEAQMAKLSLTESTGQPGVGR